MLISDSVALHQTPTYAVRPRMWGYCIVWCVCSVCSHPGFYTGTNYSYCLVTEAHGCEQLAYGLWLLPNSTVARSQTCDHQVTSPAPWPLDYRATQASRVLENTIGLFEPNSCWVNSNLTFVQLFWSNYQEAWAVVCLRAWKSEEACAFMSPSYVCFLTLMGDWQLCILPVLHYLWCVSFNCIILLLHTQNTSTQVNSCNHFF